MKTGNIAAALLVATPLNLTPKSKGALNIAMLTLVAVEAEGTPGYYQALVNLVKAIQNEE